MVTLLAKSSTVEVVSKLTTVQFPHAYCHALDIVQGDEMQLMCYSNDRCSQVPVNMSQCLSKSELQPGSTWCLRCPSLCTPFSGTLNRNMHAPGQWFAFMRVISTPSMEVGVSMGKGQMRCAGMPMSLMSRVAVTGEQKMVPLLKLLVRPAKHTYDT